MNLFGLVILTLSIWSVTGYQLDCDYNMAQCMKGNGTVYAQYVDWDPECKPENKDADSCKIMRARCQEKVEYFLAPCKKHYRDLSSTTPKPTTQGPSVTEDNESLLRDCSAQFSVCMRGYVQYCSTDEEKATDGCKKWPSDCQRSTDRQIPSCARLRSTVATTSKPK